jgi:P4 family phage/plasmid primase-like protien
MTDLTNEVYDFHIVKGKIGLYNKEIKRLMKQYRVLDEPTPIGSNTFQTSNIKLYNHLCAIGVCESVQDREVRIYNEIMIKDIESNKQSGYEHDDLFHLTESGGIVFHRNDIAKYLTDKYHARIISGKKFMFVYNSDYNIYEIEYGDMMETELNTMFGDLIDNHSTAEIMAKVWHTKGHQVRIESLVWDNLHFINFVNGVLDIKTMELHKHDPEKYFFKSIIPHKYDPGAKCPNILELLHRVFDKDEVKNQLEWIGFCLTPRYNFKIINFYVGMSNSGKSTFFDIIENMVGSVNRSSVPPQDMKSDYNLADLHDKMVNIAGDIGKERVKHFDILRSLSGLDPIRAREIYHSAFEFVNEAKLMFGCNELPKFDDVQASFNRVRIILCKHVFTVDDIKKFDKSIYMTDEEMSGLINEGIRSYKETLDRGGFFKEDSDETARIHDLMTNRIWRWSTEKLDWCDDDEGQMWMHELRLNYYNWCRKNNLPIDLDEKAFTIKFRKEFKDYFYTKEKHPGQRGGQKLAVMGVRPWNYRMHRQYDICI